MKNVCLQFTVLGAKDSGRKVLDEIWDYVRDIPSLIDIKNENDVISVNTNPEGISILKGLPKTDSTIIKVIGHDCAMDIWNNKSEDSNYNIFKLYLFNGIFSLNCPGRLFEPFKTIKFYMSLKGDKDNIADFKKDFIKLIEDWDGTNLEENVLWEVKDRAKFVNDDCLYYRFELDPSNPVYIEEIAKLTEKYSKVEFKVETFSDKSLAVGFCIKNGEITDCYSAAEDDWDMNDKVVKTTETEPVSKTTQKEEKDEKSAEVGFHPLEFFLFGAGICTVACLFALLAHITGM